MLLTSEKSVLNFHSLVFQMKYIANIMPEKSFGVAT